jgi:hypothetical protein
MPRIGEIELLALEELGKFLKNKIKRNKSKKKIKEKKRKQGLSSWLFFCSFFDTNTVGKNL